MKQRIFQILKWSGIGFIFFFLILLIVAQLYEDKIGELVVKELNKSLKQPITVSMLAVAGHRITRSLVMF